MRHQKTTQTSKGLPLDLVVGLSEQERRDFETAWRNSTYVLDRIKKLMQDRLADLQIDDREDYANPNWPFLRADKNGRMAELRDLLRYFP